MRITDLRRETHASDSELHAAAADNAVPDRPIRARGRVQEPHVRKNRAEVRTDRSMNHAGRIARFHERLADSKRDSIFHRHRKLPRVRPLAGENAVSKTRK